MLLDLNEMAKGKPFLSHRRVRGERRRRAAAAYTTDDTGFRQYKLYVKDIGTGAVQGPIGGARDEREWAADNQTLFYVTEDPVTKRSDTLWRHALGGEPVKLLHEEKDELYSIWVYRTKDRKLDVLRPALDRHLGGAARDSATPEAPLARGAAAREGPQVRGRPPRRHCSTSAPTRTPRTSALVTAPLADPSPPAGRRSSPHRPDVLLQDARRLQGLPGRAARSARRSTSSACTTSRPAVARSALPRARVRGLCRGRRPSSSRSRSATATRAWSRPPSVFDYDMRDAASRRC